MWLVKFLPDWFFYGVLFVGIVGLAVTYLLKFIPFPPLYVYRTPIQLVAVALIVIGTFMIGAVWNENAWKARIAELEKEVADAQAKSAQVTVETVTKYVDRTKVIKEKGATVVQYVDREIVKYDNVCKLPPEVSKAHNDAASFKLKEGSK